MADDGTIENEVSSPMPAALLSSEAIPSNGNGPENTSMTEASRVASKRTRRGSRGEGRSKASRPETEAKSGDSASTATTATTAENITTSIMLKHLVIDSGAIIKGAGMSLASSSENFWTVPEVLAEVRDKKARHHLEALPFELKLKEPSDEAVKFAAGFAKQTGDLRSLSIVDIRVLALTYMLEKQETGGAHLRSQPAHHGPQMGKGQRGVSVTIPALATKAKTTTQSGQGTAAETTEQTSASLMGGSSSRTSAVPAEPRDQAGNQEDEGVGLGTLCKKFEQSVTMEAGESKRDASATGDAGSSEVVANGEATVEGEEVPPTEEEQRAEAHQCREPGDEVEVVVVEQQHTQHGGESSDGHRIEEQDRCGHDANLDEADQDDEGEDEVGGDQEKADEENEDEDDDEEEEEEWEPEGVTVVESSPTRAQAEAKGETGGGFDAADFPSIGGGGTASAPGPADTAQATPSAGTWSEMARSNPAPFKPAKKAELAPLPVAAKLHEVGKAETHPADNSHGLSHPRTGGAGQGGSRILSTSAAFGVSGGGARLDDGEGWVNPSNFKAQKVAGLSIDRQPRGQGKEREPTENKCRAGCVTTDFAMQNVLVQVGLRLVSVDGMEVTRVKHWVLRCSACFKVCTEMDRLFCPVCGNATLNRVSCSVDASSGAMRLYLRKNYKHNLRGTKYSIPANDPSKGRFDGDILLREDQLLTGIWAQKVRRGSKNVKSMFGDNITSNVGVNVSKSADVVVGYGRKNPNSMRGRERRGKKNANKKP